MELQQKQFLGVYIRQCTSLEFLMMQAVLLMNICTTILVLSVTVSAQADRDKDGTTST